jgi:hypothetical protein
MMLANVSDWLDIHLPEMTLEDINSIASPNPTKLVEEFSHQIYSIKDGMINKLPCFWSCREGKLEATAHQEFATDNDYPIIRELFAYCSAAKMRVDYNETIMTALSYGISRIYALNVKNFPGTKVHVFLGSDKSSELTGFHVGNNFWKAELPVLQDLLHREMIEDIILHVCDNGIWARTISIKNDTINLPLWRRNWHPLDGEHTKNSYVNSNFTQEDWNTWRSAPPRTYITFSRLRYFAQIWRKKSKK